MPDLREEAHGSTEGRSPEATAVPGGESGWGRAGKAVIARRRAAGRRRFRRTGGMVECADARSSGPALASAEAFSPWQEIAARAMLCCMDTANPTRDESTRASRSETAAARQRRIAHEAELIAQARASAVAGRTVSEEQVDAWIDSLNTDRELPPPRSGR